MNNVIKEKEILNWYFQSGVSDTIGQIPNNRFSLKAESILLKKPLPSPIAEAKPVSQPEILPDNLLKDAIQLAKNAQTLEELKQALISFDGCSLKKTAKNTVFGQGNPHAEVMFIGEAPGGDEDRIGLPFVGVCGQLLDKMLSTIGLSRQTNIYISNIVPWRPPGNRTPSDLEISLCLPFIKRHIELISPKIIVLLGGVALSALLEERRTITQSHGIWHTYQSEGLVAPVDVLPLYHPSFLLRTPAQKKAQWHDLLMLKERLSKKE